MLPNEIKDLRNKLKLTQEAFAHKVGASMVTINRWEQGHSKPSPIFTAQLMKMAAEKPKKVVDGN